MTDTNLIPRTIASKFRKWNQRKRRKSLLLISNSIKEVMEELSNFQIDHHEDKVVLDFSDVQNQLSSIKEPIEVIHKLRLLSGKNIDRDRTLVILKNVNDSDSVHHLSSLLNEFHRKYSVVFVTDKYEMIDKLCDNQSIQIELMKPVSFYNYLKLSSQRCTATYKHFIEKEEHLIPMKKMFFDSLMDKFMEYVVLGGYSTAIGQYKENKDLSEISTLQENLLSNVRENIIMNHPNIDGIKMNMIFSLDKQYQNSYKKFSYKAVKEPARARSWFPAVELLEKNKYLTKVDVLNGGFKLYHNNTGFLINQIQIDIMKMIRERRISDEVMETYVVKSLLERIGSNLKIATTKSKLLQPFIWSINDKKYLVLVGGQHRKRFIQNLIQKHDLDMAIKIGQHNFSYLENILSVPVFFTDDIMTFIRKVEEHSGYIPDFKKKYSIY